jgi:hypothetical protein
MMGGGSDKGFDLSILGVVAKYFDAIVVWFIVPVLKFFSMSSFIVELDGAGGGEIVGGERGVDLMSLELYMMGLERLEVLKAEVAIGEDGGIIEVDGGDRGVAKDFAVIVIGLNATVLKLLSMACIPLSDHPFNIVTLSKPEIYMYINEFIKIDVYIYMYV